MKTEIFLKAWQMMDNNTVKLIYQDDDELFVQKCDFERAFGPIVSAEKSAVIRDFAIRDK